MTRRPALLLLTLLIISAGCKRQKLQKQDLPSLAGSEAVFLAADSVPDSINRPVEFRYLNTRSRISIKSRKQNIDNASVTFRVKKDSAIWMSASVMGLEVIRGIISTEGVRIMDRINKVYTEAPYRVLAGKLGFPLDYPLLQSFFLADIPAYPGQGFEIRYDSAGALVRQADGYLAIYNMIERLSRKTVSMEAIDLLTNNRALASYSDLRQAGPALIPYNVSVSLSVNKQTQPGTEEPLLVSLSHTSVNIADSTLSFPFQVPINYKKAF